MGTSLRAALGSLSIMSHQRGGHLMDGNVPRSHLGVPMSPPMPRVMIWGPPGDPGRCVWGVPMAPQGVPVSPILVDAVDAQAEAVGGFPRQPGVVPFLGDGGGTHE